METLDYSYLAQLVQRAQGGDSNAFAELYMLTYQQQYRYFKDEHLAQDALQETFVQALKHLRQLQNPELFIAWLNRINFRACYDLKRSRNDEQQEEYSEELLGSVHSQVGRTEEEVVEVDSRRYILKQVMNLPLTESQAILMKYYQNLTIPEIAESLGVSESTAKRALKSGRERLARMLPDFRYERR